MFCQIKNGKGVQSIDLIPRQPGFLPFRLEENRKSSPYRLHHHPVSQPHEVCPAQRRQGDQAMALGVTRIGLGIKANVGIILVLQGNMDARVIDQDLVFTDGAQADVVAGAVVFLADVVDHLLNVLRILSLLIGLEFFQRLSENQISFIGQCIRPEVGIRGQNLAPELQVQPGAGGGYQRFAAMARINNRLPEINEQLFLAVDHRPADPQAGEADDLAIQGVKGVVVIFRDARQERFLSIMVVILVNVPHFFFGGVGEVVSDDADLDLLIFHFPKF